MRLLVVFLLSSFFLITRLFSQTVTWNGSTDNDWHKPCNWTPSAAVPACTDNVVIPTAKTINVSGIAHCKTIAIQGTAIVNITGTGQLEVSDINACVGTETTNAGCPSANLLPNPSFEDRSCCPSALAQMNCVDSWVNASSGGSTDYFNTCGFTSPGCCGYGAPPAGLPDGNGYLGFLDTWAGSPCFCVRKEYAGVCLTGALTASQSYTFDFYIANSSGAYGITVAIFGNTNCANMPNAATTCPTSWGSGWVELGSVAMTPNNTAWQMGTIGFTAASAYTAIIVGANCTTAFGPQAQRYFYLDNLALY